MKKVIISGMIGNALEWYDYALYAQFVTIIGLHFLPPELDHDIRNIITFAIFASGFIIRPIGGILLGTIGDRFGRKVALVIGILAMAIPTAGLGLLPSYQNIGIAAPIILVIIRLIQGFALGGEFSGCIAYIVEHAELRYRGLAGSAAFASMCIGMLSGVITATLLTEYMNNEALINWGWRIPFIVGLFIGCVGLYIRKSLSESPLYKIAKENGNLAQSPLRETIVNHWRPLIIAIGIYITVTTPFYTLTVFMESFMSNLGYSKTQGSFSSLVILMSLIITLPISAWVSDRIGRKYVLFCGILLIAILSYPTFKVFTHMNYTMSLWFQVIFACAVGIYMGPVPTILVELFPTRVRFTGIALSYNISAAIFGGSAPMVGVILARYTGDKIALSYYITLLSLLSLCAVIACPETYKKEL